MANQYEYHRQRMSNVIYGNSIDIKIKGKEAAEVRADVYVESPKEKKAHIVRLWGQVKDCDNRPVPFALIKLVKVICSVAGDQYQGIAHTVSDCEGFYQFDLCYKDGSECYKVLVSKAYTGPELVVDVEGGNCQACEGPCAGGGCCGKPGDYSPCAPYEPIIVPEGKCGCEMPVPPCGCQMPVSPCGCQHKY